VSQADRLIELHQKYTAKVEGVTISGIGNDEEDAANSAYLERLDAGLSVLYLTDYILATVAALGKKSARERVAMLMDMKSIRMERVADTLREYLANLEEGKQEGEIGMLNALIQHIAAAEEHGGMLEIPQGMPAPQDSEGDATPTPPEGATPDATPPGSPGLAAQPLD